MAHHQNAIPIIRELTVTNDGETDLVDVRIALTSEPPVIAATKIRIEQIIAGGRHHVATPEVRLDTSLLAAVTEAARMTLKIVVSSGDEEIAREALDLRLLPPTHWGGGGAAPELLAAFVRPNDPAIDVVLSDAAAKLSSAGRSTAFDGYAGGQKARVWEMAEAVWAAIADRRVTYVLPPASFELYGQKVRGPNDVLERRVGTCLDLTVLLAAGLEQAGLNPVIVLTTGHAFVGLWLVKEELPAVTIDDMQALRKRRDLEEMIFIETTLLTSDPPTAFAQAVKSGAAQVEDDAERGLEIALDIRRARFRGIRPMDLMDGVQTQITPTRAEPLKQELGAPPSFVENVSISDVAETTGDRLEVWKRKLLDLTLRNKLLNFKPGKATIELECADVGALEDALSGGKAFKILPRADVLEGGDERDRQVFARDRHEDGRKRYLEETQARGEIHALLPERELENRLLELFRLSKNAFEEGGANVLFLSVGSLHWRPKRGSATSCRAPLLLIPAALTRSSVRAGFRLAFLDEEARINPTLLEMLRADFNLRMPDLESELPVDQSGIDVDRVFRIARSHVRDREGWEITDGDVALSAFSFTKFLMWKDLVERADVLKRNSLVKHLVDTPTHSYGDGWSFPETSTLDRDFAPDQIFAPLSADSSQLAAVLAAADGKDFVLFGPPGAGKSQTIANMIAQCLANGKTVLFVSQKTAALEVVQRRLNDIGLGEYCLEVHSTKAQKSSVLLQLKTAWHERVTPRVDAWPDVTAELAKLRDELNGLVRALHRPRENGMTAYDAFGRAMRGNAKVKLSWKQHQAHTPQTLTDLRSACHHLRTVISAAGSLTDHPLQGMGAAEWSPVWRTQLTEAIETTTRVLPRLDASATAYARTTRLEQLAQTHSGMRGLVVLGAMLTRPEARDGVKFLGADAYHLRDAIEERNRFHSGLEERLSRTAGKYRPGWLDLDLVALQNEWIQAQTSNFLMRGSRVTKVRLKLEPYADGPLPENLGPDIVALIEAARFVRAGASGAERLSVFSSRLAEAATPAAEFAPAITWSDKIGEVLQAISAHFGGYEAARDAVASAADAAAGAQARSQYDAFKADWLQAAEAITAVGRLAARETPAAPLAAGPGWIGQTIEALQRWSSGLHRAQSWCAWRGQAARAEEIGLGPLVSALEAGALAGDEIDEAFENAYARWWIDHVVSDDPVLRGFMVERHEDTIGRFRAADLRVANLSKSVVRQRLGGGIPAPSAFGADLEWGALARELASQKGSRQLRLRQLFARMPNVLTKLTPCLMMSPLSIAQYLPADREPFDVVIFDEASQISPWDAIGAIARGKQAIIVGDPEQLPPTNVGDRGVDDIEDGSNVADQESILDECLAANVPQRRLDWHYRSRHESLIAFSNAHYYGGRLVTFPSPVTEDRAVRLIHVPDGVYERGKARVNREEARQLVAGVIAIMMEPSFAARRRSLGVVTFNGEQQRLIENLLDEARRAQPELERFFDKTQWPEPIFVKNLENVQGDERDIIVFSIAVGRDPAGKISTTVSSLNKEGGHRRLNVAITRARESLLVYASLRPEEIDLGRSGARGVRDFKHFLEFADRGAKALAEAISPTDGINESPFEAAVQSALENRGWTVHPQVGVSGFRIDLGVVHPDRPGLYLAGVECDGATYHSSATARDRDRLREMVLTSLGWRIRRVWSTDWWMNAKDALERLDARLREDLEAERLKLAVESALPAEPEKAEPTADQPIENETLPVEKSDGEAPPLVADHDADAEDTDPLTPIEPQADKPVTPLRSEPERAPVYADRQEPLAGDPAPQHPSALPTEYRQADLESWKPRLDADRFNDADYRPTLGQLVEDVLAAEAPMYDDVLIRRVARAHGFARSGGRIKEAVLSAIPKGCVRIAEDERLVVWPKDHPPANVVGFRTAPSGVRAHADIPLCELAGLARQIRETSWGGDLIRLIAARFELTRVEASTRSRFEQAVARAQSSSPTV
jgi:very-short-patch-repair endonuclease